MPPSDPSPLSPRAALVHRLAKSLGFALVGIAPALPSDHADHLRHWLDEGKHGDMDYLAKFAPLQEDPQSVLPGAKAIICVADWYGDERHEGTEAQRHEGIETRNPEPGTRNDSDHTPNPTPHTPILGRIARYAQGDDYHHVIKNRLHELADALRQHFPDHLFRTTVDTAPLPEREHASRAGLGWVGKHTLLIHPQFGSWFLLGEILTTLPLETAAEANYPAPAVPPVDHCGSCTRCIDACPTHCITPYSVDASRCISYLTIEHRGGIDAELHPLMHDWIAGCDVCQEVCPYNAAKSEISNLQSPISNLKLEISDLKSKKSPYAPRLPSIPLLDILNWTEDDRRAAVRKSALKRIKLEMFKRNALIATGNALADEDHAPLRARIHAIAADPGQPPIVQQTAAVVIERLASPRVFQPRSGERA